MRWGDNDVVIGGTGKRSNILNTCSYHVQCKDRTKSYAATNET